MTRRDAVVTWPLTRVRAERDAPVSGAVRSGRRVVVGVPLTVRLFGPTPRRARAARWHPRANIEALVAIV